MEACHGCGAHWTQILTPLASTGRAYEAFAVPTGCFSELVFGLPALAAIGWGLTLDEPTGFIAGFLAGALAVAWMTVRDEVPGYLQTWRQGAEGEWQTHKEIAGLAGT